MKNESNINIRLPTDLKKEAIKLFGKNFSEIIRTSLEREINKRSPIQSAFRFCRVCKSLKADRDELFPFHFPYDEESLYYEMAFCCKDCLNRIAKNGLEYYKNLSKTYNLNKVNDESDKLISELLVAIDLSDVKLEDKKEFIKSIKLNKTKYKISIFQILDQLLEIYPSKYNIQGCFFQIKKEFFDEFKLDIEEILEELVKNESK